MWAAGTVGARWWETEKNGKTECRLREGGGGEGREKWGREGDGGREGGKKEEMKEGDSCVGLGWMEVENAG